MIQYGQVFKLKHATAAGGRCGRFATAPAAAALRVPSAAVFVSEHDAHAALARELERVRRAQRRPTRQLDARRARR